MNKEYKKDSDLAKILNLNRKVKKDLLKFKVIDLVVHYRDHFSRMFILNAGMIVDGLWKFHKKEHDKAVCMIHANSLPTVQGYHDSEKCASKVRAFLNQYGKTELSLGNIFNKNNLPVYELDGK